LFTGSSCDLRTSNIVLSGIGKFRAHRVASLSSSVFAQIKSTGMLAMWLDGFSFEVSKMHVCRPTVLLLS